MAANWTGKLGIGAMILGLGLTVWAMFSNGMEAAVRSGLPEGRILGTWEEAAPAPGAPKRTLQFLGRQKDVRPRCIVRTDGVPAFVGPVSDRLEGNHIYFGQLSDPDSAGQDTGEFRFVDPDTLEITMPAGKGQWVDLPGTTTWKRKRG